MYKSGERLLRDLKTNVHEVLHPQGKQDSIVSGLLKCLEVVSNLMKNIEALINVRNMC